MRKERPVILLTRPQKQSERFARRCHEVLGAEQQILQSPVLKIELLAIPPVGPKVQGLVFTSENGVFAYAKAHGCMDLPAYCVGERTAKAAAEAGLQAHSANGSSDDLVKMIQKVDVRGDLLHIRGEHTRGDILARLGPNVSELVAYRQIRQPISEVALAALTGHQAMILPMFSPRTAELFFQAAEKITAPLSVVAISQAVKEVVLGSNLSQNANIQVATTPDAAAMLRAMAGCIAA